VFVFVFLVVKMTRSKASSKKQQKRGVDFKVVAENFLLISCLIQRRLTYVVVWRISAENKAKDWQEIAAGEECYEY
jgi:hypothetical protein